MNRVMPNMPLAVDPASRDQARVNRDLTEVIRQLWLRTNGMESIVTTLAATVANLQLTITSLVAAANKIKRITVADSPYPVALFDRNLYADTDGGAITILLRPGVNEERLTVKNCGTAGNDVTLTPNGAEMLFGVNGNEVMVDGEVLDLQYETTEGWY